MRRSKLLAGVLRRVGVSEQTFYRWKKQYVGLEVDQVRQLKQVQEENQRLKQVVADLTLTKRCWQKKCKALAASAGGGIPAG
jgi:putative transposase